MEFFFKILNLKKFRLNVGFYCMTWALLGFCSWGKWGELECWATATSLSKPGFIETHTYSHPR